VKANPPSLARVFPRAFVTGAEGFAGSYLAERLLEEGIQTTGTCRPGVDPLTDQIDLIPCDITNRAALEEALRTARPDVVFHLAAVSFVPQSRQDPAAVVAINVGGTVNLLDAVRRQAPQARVVFISSAEVYDPFQSDAMSEDQAPAPASVYGATKAAGEGFVRAYGRTFGLDGVMLRPFNHIGPRQSADFVCSAFARQIAWIEAGRLEPILRVGNLEPRRDFTDVRDMVRAYWLAAQFCEAGVPYNVASGQAHPIREALEILVGLSQVPIEVQPDPARLRRGESSLRLGEASPFRRLTDWQPEIPFERSLADTLDWWRAEARE